MKKITVSLLGIILLFSIGGFTNDAKAIENEAEYDLIQGGTQQFTILDDNLEEIIITVEEQEEEPSLSRLVKSGTYKITSQKEGIWKASYDIVVSANQIKSAKNPSATAIIGSFTSKRLAVDNSKQATYYLTRKQGYLESDIKVRATLKTNSIAITN